MSDGSTRTQRIKERVRRDVDRLRASTLIIDLALVVVAIAALLTKHERAAEAAIAALVAIYLNHRKPDNPVAPLLILATFLGACDSPTLTRARWHLRFDLLATTQTEGIALRPLGASPLRGGEGGIWLPNTGGAYPQLCATSGACVDLAALSASQITSGTLPTTRGGVGLTSYTAGDLLYASGTTTLSKLGIGTEGYTLKVVSGVPAWAAAASGGGNCTILATVWDGGITTAGKFPAFDGVQWGAATAGNAIRRVLPAGSTWKIRAAITGAPGSGNTVKFEIQTSASLGGTFSADAASAVTFTNSDGANAIKTGSTFTVGGSAVIATIRAIATGADYVSPNQASVQLDCG